MVRVPPAPPKPGASVPPPPPKPETPKSALATPPPAPPRPNLPTEYYAVPSPSTATSSHKRTESSVAESEFETEDEDGLVNNGSTRDTADSNASTKGSDTDGFKDAKAAGLRADVAAFDGDAVGLSAYGLTGTRAKELAKERARHEDEARWEAVLKALAAGELPA